MEGTRYYRCTYKFVQPLTLTTIEHTFVFYTMITDPARLAARAMATITRSNSECLYVQSIHISLLTPEEEKEHKNTFRVGGSIYRTNP